MNQGDEVSTLIPIFNLPCSSFKFLLSINDKGQSSNVNSRRISPNTTNVVGGVSEIFNFFVAAKVLKQLLQLEKSKNYVKIST